MLSPDFWQDSACRAFSNWTSFWHFLSFVCLAVGAGSREGSYCLVGASFSFHNCIKPAASFDKVDWFCIGRWGISIWQEWFSSNTDTLFHSCRWAHELGYPLRLKRRCLPSLSLPLPLWPRLVSCLAESCIRGPSGKLETKAHSRALTIPSYLSFLYTSASWESLFCPPLSFLPKLGLNFFFEKLLLFKLIHLNYSPKHFVWDLQHDHLFLFTYFYLTCLLTTYVSLVSLTRF